MLAVEYMQDIPWLHVRLRTADSGQITCIAKVDSGATVSLLPRALARALGLGARELVECASAHTAGGPMRTWQAQVPIELDVFADQGSGANGPQFGPPVVLHGVVGENSTMLLGQQDFFRAFDVLFDRNADIPVFELRA